MRVPSYYCYRSRCHKGKGSHFFYKTNGSQFFVRGINYYPPTRQTPRDAFQLAELCARDIPALLALGITVVNVRLDEGTDHSKCFALFQNANIYVLAFFDDWDLVGRGKDSGYDPSTIFWDITQYTYFQKIIDALAMYPNILGFVFGGGLDGIPFDVGTQGNVMPFFRAIARDVKTYMASRGYRDIPIGAYGMSTTTPVTENLSCGRNSAETIDFWGVVDYTWLNDSSRPKVDDYLNLTSRYGTLGKPLFLVEGSNQSVADHGFAKMALLFAQVMSQFWSGIIAGWWHNTDEYPGNLLNLANSTSNDTLELTAGYTTLSKAFEKVSATSTSMIAYTPTISLQACSSTYLGVPQSILPPSPDPKLCTCMEESLSCITQSITGNDFGDLSELVCSSNSSNCIGTQSNATTGKYGAFGSCTGSQQFSWLVTAHYNNQIQLGIKTSCEGISGKARSQVPMAQSETCKTLLKAAGPKGEHVVDSRSLLGSNATSFATPSISVSSSRDGNQDHRLTPGMISGISISIVCFLGILIGTFLCWKRHSKTIANSHTECLPSSKLSDSDFMDRKAELEDCPIVELPAHYSRLELWTNMNTSEMPANIPISEMEAAEDDFVSPLSNTSLRSRYSLDGTEREN